MHTRTSQRVLFGSGYFPKDLQGPWYVPSRCFFGGHSFHRSLRPATFGKSPGMHPSPGVRPPTAACGVRSWKGATRSLSAASNQKLGKLVLGFLCLKVVVTMIICDYFIA